MHTWNPGINHIEFWVSDLKRSLTFYEPLFSAIGWRKLGENEFSCGSIDLYFVEKSLPKADTVGPRHICFQATSRDVVDKVGKLLKDGSGTIIRGPIEAPEYSKDYYTIDFRDPDGYVIEVAHTPNMAM
jgi:catechol 2,3-dioxygenase-like lactoylglutathione lyase family enzyme